MCYECDDYYLKDYGLESSFKAVLPCHVNISFEIFDSFAYNQKTILIKNCGPSSNLSCSVTVSMETLQSQNLYEVENYLNYAFSELINADNRVITVINQILDEMFNTKYVKFVNYNKGGMVKSSNHDGLYSQGGAKYKLASPRPSELDTFPGLKMLVKYPVKNSTMLVGSMTLERTIIALNDTEKWTREQIADWLETLDVDITFKTKETDE